MSDRTLPSPRAGRTGSDTARSTELSDRQFLRAHDRVRLTWRKDGGEESFTSCSGDLLGRYGKRGTEKEGVKASVTGGELAFVADIGGAVIAHSRSEDIAQ